MLSNKKFNLVLLLVITSLAFIFFLKKPQKPSNLSNQNTPSDLPLQNLTLSEIAQRPVQTKETNSEIANSPTTSSDPKPDCHGLYAWMASKSSSDVEMQLSENLKLNELECIQTSKTTKDGLTFERCQKKDRQGISEQKFDGMCRALYTSLRARAISELYSTDQSYRNMDLTILINMVWDWSGKELSGEQLRRFQEMTRALMERRPSDVGVLKAHLFSFGVGSVSPEIAKYQQSLVDRGLLLSPQDRELIENRLALYYFSNSAQALLNYVRSNSQESLGYYYYGSFQWKLGNKQEALRYLGQASKIEPQNSRYQSTYNAATAKSPSEQKSILQVESSFSLEIN